MKAGQTFGKLKKKSVVLRVVQFKGATFVALTTLKYCRPKTEHARVNRRHIQNSYSSKWPLVSELSTHSAIFIENALGNLTKTVQCLSQGLMMALVL